MHFDLDGRHGPVTGAISAATTCMSSAYIAEVAHLSPGWPGAVALAGLAGTHITGVRRKVSAATLGLRAASWIATGGWCAWAAAEGPWTRNVLAALAAGAVGLGCAMAGAHRVEEKKADEKVAADAAAWLASLDGKRRKIAEEWQQRITLVCTGATVRIIGVEEWASAGGYTLDAECLNGTKWRDLLPYVDNLAAEARLPEGCGVEVKAGQHRGAVLIDVATVNALIADADYPADYSPLHLDGPSPHGLFRDGSPCAPNQRQRSGFTAGRRGSGKTNLMNVKLANQCRQDDNLSWVIDLNGGGLALAWLHAWHTAGRPGRPPVDWVADTPQEALKMTRALLRIAKARKPGYKALEIAANDDKLPVSPQVPGITLDNDEIAELFSPKARRDPVLREVGDTIVQILELGRAVACNVENAALRATQDVVTEPQLVKQASVKIGMKSDEAEMAYLFGWSDRVSPEEAPYAGCGFMKVDDDPARPFKVFRIKPNQIRDIVVATAERQPDLDDLSRTAAGQDYENRWDGKGHLFGESPAPAASVYADPDAAPEPQHPRGSGVTANWGTEPPRVDTQAALDQADAARDAIRKAAEEATGRDPDLEQEFQAILEAGGALWKAPATEQPERRPVRMPTPGVSDDPRWLAVFSIVAKAGPAGVGPTAIGEFFASINPGVPVPSRSAITTWVQAEPQIHQPATGKYALRPEEK